MAEVSTIIPGVLNQFRVYNNKAAATKAMLGISDEVTMPDVAFATTTVSGAGILGEIEEIIMGQMQSMSMTIPFRVNDQDSFEILKKSSAVDLTLRGSEQYTDGSTGDVDFRGHKLQIKGKIKKYSLGKASKGGTMDANIEIEITYLKYSIDDAEKLEIDKYNFKYSVDGVDQLAKVRSQC